MSTMNLIPAVVWALLELFFTLFSGSQSSMSPSFSPQSSSSQAEDSAFDFSVEQSLDHIFAELLQGDFQQRWQAMKGITDLGEAAVPPLLDLMQDDQMDWEIRWFVARALGQFPQPVVLQSLVDLLTTTQEPELRSIATSALGQFGQAGVNALAQLMHHPQHQLLAVQTLAGMRQPEALAPLLAAAHNDDSTVRCVAVTALGSFRGATAGATLLRALKDTSAAVRQEAATALGRQFDGLGKSEVVDHLVPCLWDISLPVCQAVARTLGRLGTTTAIEALTQVAQAAHTPEVLQMTTVQALGWQPQMENLAALLSVKEHVSQGVQLEIIAILGRMGQPEEVRSRAGQALEDWLKGHLHDPLAATLKRSLAMALGHLKISSARPLLYHLALDADERIALYAHAALRQLAA